MLETDLQPLAEYNEPAAGPHRVWAGVGGNRGGFIEAGDWGEKGCLCGGGEIAVGAGGGAWGAPMGPLTMLWFHLTLTTEKHTHTPLTHTNDPFVAK